jgi:hypothetical protein
MESLLTTLLTLVAVMLVLALAAQSIQEIIKAMFTIKGQTARRALKGLITESARAEGQHASAADILKSVEDRLRSLGQNGVRAGALRLDALNKTLLADLIRSADPSRISGLSGPANGDAKEQLEAIADRATIWYPLAMEPVDDRYRRRMRGYALLSSAIVVFGLNADAWTVFQKARTDKVFQAGVAADVAKLDSLYRRAQQAGAVGGDSAKVSATKTTRPAPKRRADSTARGKASVPDRSSAATRPADSAAKRSARDTTAPGDALNRELALLLQTDRYVFGKPGAFRWGDPVWWVGMVASVLLVSLGAPFWHDALEALFGLKNRIKAQAKREEDRVPDEKNP